MKILLANGVKTFFINGKQAVINGLRKLGKPPFWLVIFLAVPFIKIPLFFKEFITFVISFISLFVRNISEPVIDEIPFLILLPIIWSPVSTRISLVPVPVFSNCILWLNYFATDFIIFDSGTKSAI